MNEEPMVGGDFLLTAGSTISQSTMTALASMSGIPGLASFSSFTQITSLSPPQISTIISELEILIAGEQNAISLNNSTIMTIKSQINTPVTGYQDIYNSTVIAYSTSVRNYNTQVQLRDNTLSTISSMTVSLSSLMLEDANDVSTIVSYQRQYSTLMVQMQANNDMLNSQISVYNGLSTTYMGYIKSYNNLLSTTVNINEPSTILGISTQMMEYIRLENQVSTLIQSTLNNISNLKFYSTTYSGDLSIYSSSYVMYSNLENQTMSTINNLLAQKTTLTTTIGGYQTQLYGLQQSSINAFGTLQGQSDTFYSQKLTQIQNQLLSFKYSVQEWRAFIGYLVSQLTIQRTNLSGNVNLLSFQISQIQSSDPVTAAALSAQQSGYTTQQNTINGIIGALNPLDTSTTPSFASILAICDLESGYRADYINIRKSMTNIEIAVLQNPYSQAGYKSQYLAMSGPTGTLAAKAADINAKMIARWADYSNLLSIINPQLTAIRGLGTLVYSLPQQQPNTGIPFDVNPADFQITPQLTFNI